MTLDEAIKHAEEVAEDEEKNTGYFYDKESANYKKKCCKCAKEHRQLAEWLKELKFYRVMIPSASEYFRAQKERVDAE